ncbi:sensor domain-containing protein [Cognatilysobacter xinjiangensis]|uniref:sensor domain-containing protein n=1 Tax=Cognatilysobacter xinjiangensis TaxID=546892 RepID=UPI00167B32AB|nr:EAL domain-containing protein [Lysobacter xinjiangensis]
MSAPLLFALLAGGAMAAATRWLPPPLAAGLVGMVVGGWAGLWLARPLRGRADLRWLLGALGVLAGCLAVRLSPVEAIVATAVITASVAALRALVRRLHPHFEWDDPAPAAGALAALGVAALALSWALADAVHVLPGAWLAAWPALALGAVAAYVTTIAFASLDPEDPFAEDPRRTTLILAAALLLGAAALAFWSPRLVPLLALGLLAIAAAGRPRTLGALSMLVAIGALAIAARSPALLSRMAGGWSVGPALGLVATMLALAMLGCLLVHQRDRVRARLRAASGHLLTLAEKSPGLVATFDRRFRHRHVNDAYQRWSGLTRERLEGATLADVLGADFAARIDSSAARAMAGASQHLQAERADRVLDVRLEPYFGLDGAIAGFHLLAEDVTWRQQGERDLRTLVNAAPEPTLVLDEDGRIEMHNAAAASVFGAQGSDLVGATLANWLSENGLAAAQADGVAGMRARRSDGTTFPVELKLGSMPGEHGGRAVVTLRDLSRDRALEDAARAAREQAQATLDSISDALVVVDPAGTVTAFNPAATELTGWTREDALGRVLEEVVRLVEPGRAVPQVSVLREALKTGKPSRLEGERELVRRDGAQRAVEESASPLRDAQGRATGGVLLLRDVSHAREQAQALTHMAQHDALTGLPNRVLFQDRLTQALAQVPQGRRGAVLYIDLDKFKPINDTLGHPVGDRVLQEVSARLKACVREDDTVSRQGGDEFVLLLQRLADPRDAARVAEKLIRSVEQPIMLDGHELRVGASVGIALYPQDSREARTLMKQADTALYHVKETGRGRYSYFTDVMGESAEARMRVEHDLRLALAHEDFVLDYQPVASTRGGWRSVEALLRWRRDDGAVTLPKGFLDVAEETGLIVQIDEWVLLAACRQAQAWQASGAKPLPVSVNLSLARFDPERLIRQVRTALTETGLAPQWLELEFRGAQLFAQGERGRALVVDLRALGVRVAVDDIGSGQASVEQLADYAFDALKLDLSIVNGLPEDDRARRIARAICHMGSALGYPVIAKGVEADAHRDLLTAWGCAGLQGSLFSPPLDAERVAELTGLAPGPVARRA